MVVRLPTGPARDVFLLKRALKEAHALGVKFRLTGAAVECADLERLPATLRTILTNFAATGLLWAYLGGENPDEEALDLLAQLDVDAVLVETRASLRAAIREIEGDKRQHGGTVGLDIETTPQDGQGATRPFVRVNIDGALSAQQPEWKERAGLDPHRAAIKILQLYAGGNRAYVCRGEALALLLHSHWLRRQCLIAHNAAFEISFLQHHGAYRLPPDRRPQARIDCTMQAAGLLIGVEKRSLANSAQSFFALDVPKALQTSDWGARHLSAGQVAYAAADAILTFRLWAEMAPHLQTTGRWAAYELQRRAMSAVVDMRLRGLGIDREEHSRQTEMWARELAQARRDYYTLTGDPPPSTSRELQAWLASILEPAKLATWPRTPTGELSTKATYLKRLVPIDSARPVLALLAKEKLLANFGAKLVTQISPITGRVHGDYNIAGAKSGRFTASHPNMQQLPATKAPEFKRCFVAAPGNMLVGCDWSQIELRAFAWISGDKTLTRQYAEGRDIHSETAARVAGVAVGAVTKEQRQAAKPTNFGAIYGIGPRSLAENAFAGYGIEMTERQAKHALDTFFATYWEGARWRQDHARLCQGRGYVAIGAGRIVKASWESCGHLSFPQCCNLPVQGACADAMLRAVTMTYTRLRTAGIRGGLVACVHDELLLEVAEDDAEIAREILEQAMRDAFTTTFPGAPVNGVATAAIGRTWAAVKE
jgi:DNA polymerase I-like protein with 3'-5' exonuclease and polymerase domains